MTISDHPEHAKQPDDKIMEIHLDDIISFLKRSRRAMIFGALIGGILGALYAFSKPNEYTSQVIVLPELQSKGTNLGNLGSLAGLAGIDVNSMTGGTDAVRPELYPNVLQSVPFFLSLLSKPVYVKTLKRGMSLETYLNETHKLGLLGSLSPSDPEEKITRDLADTSSALRITKEEERLSKALLERVTGTYDKKSGMLTISSTMQDPVVAAIVSRHSLTYLTDYITTYRTERARRQVDFLSQQLSSAKQRYQSAEYNLSSYRDRNRSVFLNTAKIEEQRIQADFLLAQDLYNTLSKQYEMAKIKVQEETPVFKVMEPAQVPLKKSGPKRSVIVLVCVIVGALLALLWVSFLGYRLGKTI
ncbi:Wzz/FepE/Etk N-terminal domain-containing protein [Fibrella aquatica]|uniref:Wzz/FepE/Etk N-terminal domain-containing protein n=1 Tax=Fibrella aquatica TaxID=3242487 RepID=UPI003521C38C